MSEGRGSMAGFESSFRRTLNNQSDVAQGVSMRQSNETESEAAVNSNDVSILNYTMDEFIQSQLDNLEMIGTTGELFQEVWKEY